jgi:class 3 adenylate cyclase
MFLDVVDYTAFVMNSELAEVVVFMNALYIEMDLLAAKHKVGKLETVGDSYVVVTSARDTVGLLNFGTDVLTKYGSRLRVGIDFGVVADVVLGHDKLRQSCIGHAVNCASRMQSTGKPGMMHVSTRVRDVASRPVAEADLGSFVPREGLVLIKGVGEEQTFFFVPAPTPQM